MTARPDKVHRQAPRRRRAASTMTLGGIRREILASVQTAAAESVLADGEGAMARGGSATTDVLKQNFDPRGSGRRQDRGEGAGFRWNALTRRRDSGPGWRGNPGASAGML